ncbi:MAG: HIT family hydrolase [Nitrospinae bacterium RIFCSPLOWO2_12_FULL_45_22]|nr:MAG: HIT family hydrolase [Nitrospinae bacterium RIFCSPLOWO2_12_FULL_45_22]
MKQLWAPWRLNYILEGTTDECIFCVKPKEDKDKDNLILFRGKHAFVIMNLYPYGNGHLMIVPYEHARELNELPEGTLLDLMLLTRKSENVLKKIFQAQGFNIGINLGKAAGAGIDEHLHIHIVPRWIGDTNFMPVLADIKVIPQHIWATYDLLLPFFREEK